MRRQLIIPIAVFLALCLLAAITAFTRLRNVAVDLPAIASGTDDGRVNAYDTIASGQADRLVEEYLDRRYWLAPIISKAVTTCLPGPNKVMRALLLMQPVVLTIHYQPVLSVRFNDGSGRIYAYDRSVAGYTPLAGTARDAHLNVVPENAEMSANGGMNVYDFSGSGPGYDEANLVRLLKQYRAVGNYGGRKPLVTCAWVAPTSPPLRCHAGMP